MFRADESELGDLNRKTEAFPLGERAGIFSSGPQPSGFPHIPTSGAHVRTESSGAAKRRDAFSAQAAFPHTTSRPGAFKRH